MTEQNYENSGLLTSINYEEKKHILEKSQNIRSKSNDFRLEKMKDIITQKKNDVSLPRIKTRSPKRSIHKVKRYLRNNEEKLGDLSKNFRHPEKGKSLKNKKFSKSFFYSRKKVVEKKVNSLYEKNRQKIISNLKLLERKRLFRSELEIKQKELITQRSQFNDLTHQIKKRKQELKYLTELWQKLESEYDTKDVEISTKNHKKKLEETNILAIKETFESQILNQKLQNYKEDLNCIQLKILRWKNLLKKMGIIEDEITTEEYKMNQKFTNFITKTLESKNSNLLLQEPKFKEIIENQLGKFENKLIFEQIKEKELEIEKEKKAEKLVKKKSKLIKDNKKHKHKWKEQKIDHLKMLKKLDILELKANNLLHVMKLSKLEEISPRYNNLIEDEKCVDIIIKQHKDDIREIKENIENLKEVYFKNNGGGRDDGRGIDSTDETEESERKFGEGEGEDVNVIIAKEKRLIELKFLLAIEEQNYTRVWETHQKACNVISRIMYQLEPFQKMVAVEVDQDNFMEYLSHISLRLERMLAFIKSRSKEVENEGLMMKEIEILDKINGDEEKIPQSIGLKVSNKITVKDVCFIQDKKNTTFKELSIPELDSSKGEI